MDEDNGHSVVHRRGHGIRGSGKNREGVDQFPIGPLQRSQIPANA
jgi:hypothetical protein